MDEETVKSLIATALGDFETKITTAIDSKNAGLAASLTREIKKLVPESKPSGEEKPEKPAAQGTDEGAGAGDGRLTLKMLQQQLQQQTDLINSLKTESERKDREAFNARKSSALMAAITKQKAINPSALSKLLNLEFGESLKAEGDNWMVEQGDSVKSLDDAIAAYLGTDEGKAFLPPSGTAGAGSSESRSSTTSTSSSLSAGEALMQVF